jgi:hypothetical protein
LGEHTGRETTQKIQTNWAWRCTTVIPALGEVEAGLKVQSQPRLYRETLSQKQNKTKTKKYKLRTVCIYKAHKNH